MNSRRLYTPVRVGSIELPNRLIMAAMETGFCNDTDSLINDGIIEYFRLRAKGHPGLIIVGGGMIDPDNRAIKDMINICDDSAVEGLRRLTDAIHAEGTKCFIQLLHAGAYARSEVYDGIGPVAPSEVRSNFTGEMPHELTVEEIEHIEKLYAGAAVRAADAGFDGIEICANSGYLQCQFLSPVTNRRTDRYGGSLDNRMTFLKETLSAVKEAAGTDFPVSVRLGGNDLVKGGNTIEDAVQIAAAAEDAGADMISVTGGWHEAQVPQVTPDVPAGAYFMFGRRIKEAVTIPVTQSNRMNPQLAEQLVENGVVDMVTLARPFLAEPLLADKAKAGDYDSIRPCIACNQGCLDNLMRQKPIRCLVNATVGFEDKYVKDGVEAGNIPADVPLNILVIGGGVAGMEFAATAAGRGHKVTIWERTEKLGGQVNLAAVPEGKRSYIELARYLEDSCLRAGVAVELGRKADEMSVREALSSGEFDKIVFASGARPVMPPIEIEDGAYVLQAWDVLAGATVPGKNVVVIGGGAVGVETAIHLASIGTLTPEQFTFLYRNHVESPEYLESLLYKGCLNVSIIEMTSRVGRDIGVTTKWIAMSNLKKYEISQYKNSKVIRIAKDGVDIEYLNPEKEGESPEVKHIGADAVVLAAGSRAENEIYERLKNENGLADDLYAIGDCSRIGKIIDAIADAYKLAVTI